MEIVVAEAQKEFGGEDTVHPDVRHMLDHTAERLVDLHKESGAVRAGGAGSGDGGGGAEARGARVEAAGTIEIVEPERIVPPEGR